MSKVNFSSRIGLIAATVGSAVGLGNIWRFPAETQANGGGAFLLVYIICMLVLGIPVMLAEFSLGRGTQSDAESAFKKLKPKSKWNIVGILAIVASYMILSFYAVVAGWTFEYLVQSITGNLFSGIGSIDKMDATFHHKMEEFICSDISPLISTYVILALNFFILFAGVQKGIERMSNWMMPILFMLLLIFAGVSLSLPDSIQGIEYFFKPDFSKITPRIIVNALGQSFFSLSLGMGILITYSAYYPKKTKLVNTAFTVSLLDLLMAVLMGIIIFPAVMSFGLEGSQLRGTTLVFVTLPEIFAQMPASQLWAVLFFLLLLIAALTSTISIAEVTVAWLQNSFRQSRLKACVFVILPLFLLSALCSLSFGSLDFIKIAGLNIFNLLDTVATNIMLPTVALLTCIFIGWSVKTDFLKNQITNNGKVSQRIYPVISFIIRFIAPGLLLLVLVSAFLEL